MEDILILMEDELRRLLKSPLIVGFCTLGKEGGRETRWEGGGRRRMRRERERETITSCPNCKNAS